MRLKRRLVVTGLLLITAITFVENSRTEVFEPGSSFQSYEHDPQGNVTTTTFGFTDDSGDTFINSYNPTTGGYRNTFIFSDNPDNKEPPLGRGLGDF